jgi:hypothetical protein
LQYFFKKIDASVKFLYPLDFGALAVLPHGQIVGFCGIFRTFGGCILKIIAKSADCMPPELLACVFLNLT